jgi:hypothetical protein
VNISASRLKKLLISPAKVAIDIMGYKYTDCNFRFAKGHAVEAWLDAKRKLHNPHIGLYYNRSAWKQLSHLFKDSGMDMESMQDEFEVEWSLAHFVKDILSTTELAEEDQETILLEYVSEYSETIKYENLEINIPANARYQPYICGSIYDRSIECVGYIDWLGDSEGIDLKVSSRSVAPTLGDKVQIRIYEKLTKKPFKLVYVTPPTDKVLSGYKKDYNILSMVQEGKAIKDVVTEMCTTKQYVDKVLSRELAAPTCSIVEYVLTEEDIQFLDRLIPRLIDRYMKILTMKPMDIIDLVLVDYEDFHYSKSEKKFIKAHIMGEEGE